MTVHDTRVCSTDRVSCAGAIGHDVHMKQLVRPREGRIIAGACLAVANRFGVNVVAVRILTVLAMVFFGLSIWIYLLLWVLIPSES